MRRFILSMLLMTGLFTQDCFAQKDAGIKALLSPEGELVMPVKIATVSAKIKIKPKVTHDETMGDDYVWKTASGLVMGTVPDVDRGCVYFNLTADKGQILSGLPYGLVINSTTLKDCKALFKSNITGSTQLYSMDNTKEKGGFLLKIKKGKYYAHLLFNKQNILEEIDIALFDIDSAN